MSELTVCISVCGDQKYYKAMRQCMGSVIEQSRFNLFIGHGPEFTPKPPATPRVQQTRISLPDLPGVRARPFLYKFLTLEKMLARTQGKWVMQLDVDTVMVHPLTTQMVERALDGHALGMAEQTTITGSQMTRADFLKHYTDHSLAWIDPQASPPELKNFHYFNSGVVLGLRSEFEKLVPWALEAIGRTGNEHRVGQHMIADQDYFQYWANNLYPESCALLNWRWNHCRHWDQGFPHKDAYVLHFSNFCNGIGLFNLWNMRYRRFRALNRHSST
ncbi:hypothetical protein [Dethiosulfatarculus sandiegensis]|uniref:Nucleotide-diphospho-sugar transferase domain-containing protein n=1 Tax=Dethiosulfatarculus sandiegensis TaxID=1429043 RepID=A0A0D2GL53_9BACT|nr:hypothetical protein [Dethiosulfatarculus sandiegensis]KIX15437.1 hypothetical protein X474_03855 [Dethiosulfatarculus sandiegensis]